MREVTRNGERAEFFYDGQGMLAGKRVNGEYEAWTWDGLALVARGEERYVNEGHISGGVPVLSRSREGVRYHQTDILGTTLATYTVDGKMEPILASAFGAEMGAGSLSGTRRFTGKPYDRHLGAHVFPYRNYDATVARWRSSDPAGFPDGPNGHFYAPVPTMGLDPWGLRVEVYSHGIQYTSFKHAKLVISPENPGDFSDITMYTNSNGEKYFTIGAGPDFENGMLTGEINRPTDVNLIDSTNHGQVTGQNGLTDTEFIQSLLNKYNNYDNDVGYTSFPYEEGNERNSNSYISGLLNVLNAQGIPNLSSSTFPGWDIPLDMILFEP